MTAEVVCLGLATHDVVVPMSGWPDPDGRLLTDAFVPSGGGPAATAAVALARLGRRVAFVGAVGDDERGSAIRAGLADAGVDVSGLVTLSGRSSESVILLDQPAGTRAILHAPGVALRELGAGDAACRAAAWVHVDHAGYGLTDSLERGRLSVDAGNPIPELSLAGLGLYAPTSGALRVRYPDRELLAAVRAALDEGAERVAVTLGGDGALAADASGAWRIGAVSVEVVSTLGAGDVFHGALLAGLLEGRSMGDAVRLANVAAALSCRAIDGRGAIPDRAELERALRRAPSVEPIMLEGWR